MQLHGSHPGVGVEHSEVTVLPWVALLCIPLSPPPWTEQECVMVRGSYPLSCKGVSHRCYRHCPFVHLSLPDMGYRMGIGIVFPTMVSFEQQPLQSPAVDRARSRGCSQPWADCWFLQGRQWAHSYFLKGPHQYEVLQKQPWNAIP